MAKYGRKLEPRKYITLIIERRDTSWGLDWFVFLTYKRSDGIKEEFVQILKGEQLAVILLARQIRKANNINKDIQIR